MKTKELKITRTTCPPWCVVDHSRLTDEQIIRQGGYSHDGPKLHWEGVDSEEDLHLTLWVDFPATSGGGSPVNGAAIFRGDCSLLSPADARELAELFSSLADQAEFAL